MKYNLYGKIVNEQYLLTLHDSDFNSASNRAIINKNFDIHEFLDHYVENTRKQQFIYQDVMSRMIIPSTTVSISNNTSGYEKISEIDTDKIFDTGMIINDEGKDYTVTYKYNLKDNVHELYIEKIVKTVVDEEDKKVFINIKNNISDIIFEHNERIKECVYSTRKENKNIVAKPNRPPVYEAGSKLFDILRGNRK